MAAPGNHKEGRWRVRSNMWEGHTVYLCYLARPNYICALWFYQSMCVFVFLICLHLCVLHWNGTALVSQCSACSVPAQVCVFMSLRHKSETVAFFAGACVRMQKCWVSVQGVLVNVLFHFLEWKQQFSHCGAVRTCWRNKGRLLNGFIHMSQFTGSQSLAPEGSLHWRITGC